MGFTGAHDEVPDEKQVFVLDGRNRLEAMDRAGLRIISPEGYLAVNKEHVSAKVIGFGMEIVGGTGRLTEPKEKSGNVPDPVAYVISANIKAGTSPRSNKRASS
jgi:hypothetical protein